MLISKFDTNDIESKISEFEKKLQINLPDAYKEFMKKYNGGKTPKTDFKINRISSDVRAFYAIGQSDIDYSFDTLINNKIIDEFLEDGMLPIATTIWGDYVTICIEEKEVGKIYFLYHDREKHYVLLCESLSDFIGKCKSKKIGHIRTIAERKQCMIENGYGDMITEESLKGWQAEIDEYANIHQEKVIL